MDRRTFLRVSAISAAGIWLPVKDGKGDTDGGQAPQADVQVREGVKPSSWITPNDEFYVQDITEGEHPSVDVAKWKLIVNGLVKKPKLMRFDDILAMPPVMTVISCTASALTPTNWTSPREVPASMTTPST